MSKRLTLQFRNLRTGGVHEVEGQFARTLHALVEAGQRGVTALEVGSWALRLAHYILILRRLGLVIDMQREKHGGSAPGWHGRYVLQTGVQIIDETREAA